jgi:hypothetical protein
VPKTTDYFWPMACDFLNNAYGSVDRILKEEVDTLLSLPNIKELLPGAKVAIREKLADMKVMPVCSCTRNMFNNVCVCLCVDWDLQCVYI